MLNLQNILEVNIKRNLMKKTIPDLFFKCLGADHHTMKKEFKMLREINWKKYTFSK